MATTQIEIIYHLRDGRRESLGTGVIDNDGRIDITAPRAGQEDYVARQMAALNARDYVVLKLPPAPGETRYAINKQKVYRTSPEFLPALKDYGMRVLSMEFVFDDFLLVPGLIRPDVSLEIPERPKPLTRFGDG